MECTFCGRSPTTLRDLVTAGEVGVCVTCVADFLGYVLAPRSAPAWERVPEGGGPCALCGGWRYSSAQRFRRGDSVVCAACVALAARMLTAARPFGVRRIPNGLAAELQRGCEALRRCRPDLALGLAQPKRPGPPPDSAP